MNRIKKLLDEKGIYQTELADRMNLSKAAISQLLRLGNPRLETLVSVAKALDVPVWELLISRQEMCKEFTPEINGFIKVKGELYVIESIADLKKVMEMVEGDKE